MKKQQEYLVTLINLHIYNQPFITGISNQDVNNISFIIIFIYTLIKEKSQTYAFDSFVSYQLTCKTSSFAPSAPRAAIVK